MSLCIYNTLSRQLESFLPLQPGHVSMYVCGMTVYDFCHLGHARSMIAFDLVQRWLKAGGLRVNYVRNITDIDDKIIRRAVQNNETIRALTDRMIDALHQDADALGIERPSHEPRATDYVPQMLSMISTLEQKGLAYRSLNGDVNYAVRKFPGYGKLSGKSIDELHAGERVAVLDGKEDPLDPVLWKSAKASEPDEVKWASAFGPGRPGWHIECSAMACELLGQTIDIHGGGMDLQFPHHENEIAQSEGANGAPLAHYWMHNGFINIDEVKMSKSLGNFFLIRDVLKIYAAETVRFFIVRAHYRSALSYSNVQLDDARGSLKRLYTALDLVAPAEVGINWCAPSNSPVITVASPAGPVAWVDARGASVASGAAAYAQRFKAALDEDFATPEAVAVLYEVAGEVNRTRSAELAGVLKAMGACLGLLQADPKSFLQAGTALDDSAVQQQIAARAAAKAAKNFAEADRIRKALLEQGIVLNDSPSGTTWAAAH